MRFDIRFSFAKVDWFYQTLFELFAIPYGGGEREVPGSAGAAGLTACPVCLYALPTAKKPAAEPKLRCGLL